ncbi:gamma-glutamyl-gamma-aminobutyrate hydrolase family protein [Arthrobacter sp. UYEF3]|uniref:gamma-glutamyl-gamma-aminobutyrate hydrolase family protein n=1 Tax=Arthrobacter sp. UYEF3 TaxID=1756365 RepID=UPI0033948932
MQTLSRPSGGRPRIGIPVRLSSSAGADPRVGKANALFGYIVDLLREGGADPVLLTAAEQLELLDGVVLPGGGALFQDMVPGAVAHRVPASVQDGGPWAWHEVGIAAGSKVAGLYGAAVSGAAAAVTVKIASGHHQAVARVADGLIVTATAHDGTVEALEDPVRWVASVQWHPEARELPAEARLAPFRAFVEVCRHRPATRQSRCSSKLYGEILKA